MTRVLAKMKIIQGFSNVLEISNRNKKPVIKNTRVNHFPFLIGGFCPCEIGFWGIWIFPRAILANVGKYLQLGAAKIL